MLPLEKATPRLAIGLRVDPPTGLLLLSEEHALFELVLTYLQLPYSVAEYGCGKKATLILSLLGRLGVPLWALKRGLVLEADLSEAALAELEAKLRPGALIVDNPLYRLGDLRDPILREMLHAASPRIRVEGNVIHAGHFALHHAPRVQFVRSRSHVFPVVTFWDPRHGRVVDRVFDPTLSQGGPFDVSQVRRFVRAPEALVFEAPLLGRFRLKRDDLTLTQVNRIRGRLGEQAAVEQLGVREHAELVRWITGAPTGTIGDPDTWTYANNLHRPEDPHRAVQQSITGRSDAVLGLSYRLRKERERGAASLTESVRRLNRKVARIDVTGILRHDARRAEQELELLVAVALTATMHHSLTRLARTIDEERPLLDHLRVDAAVRNVRGLGVRLRRRIEYLALASEGPDGRFDARALSEGYNRTVLETIGQMNAAGLSVCVDAVGNIHGLRLDAARRSALGAGRVTVAELTRHALVFGSHIDAGPGSSQFEGRLGVASGIEIAEVLGDLNRHFGVRVPKWPVVLCVSAYLDGQSTFGGEEIVMPGSAAVAGLVEPEQVYELQDEQGECLWDRLIEMLRYLRAHCADGTIALVNRFASTEPKALLRACFHPREFYTRHSYERTVDSGSWLHDRGIPMALVHTLGGIQRQDVTITGSRCEAAAIEAGRRLRAMASGHDLVCIERRRRSVAPGRSAGRAGPVAARIHGVRCATGGGVPSLRLVIDAFGTESAALEAFRNGMRSALSAIETRYTVTVQTGLRRWRAPKRLDSGQALIVERSYGGSRNPLQTELIADLSRGTILQLALALQLLSRPGLDREDVAECVRRAMPERWARGAEHLVSLAPHDTYNLAPSVPARESPGVLG